MTSFGERLKARRKELEMTQNALGKEVGVSGAAISQLEKGDTKGSKGENLFALARALQCSPEWLLTGNEQLTPEKPMVIPGPPVTGVYPLISWEQLNEAGSIKKLPIDGAPTYPSITPCSESTFILPVSGISMAPKFDEGEMIYVDPEKPFKNGSYVVAKASGEAVLRQLIQEGTRLFLKPANPNWPEQLIEIDAPDIFGVVISSVTLV
ncbi:S24 family peptidase [Spartinivicinus ruber]|uniref:S24 family peptidase n=1 Tax=Spartinivicinus ruber TaxID=2683272 RepID=UPI0013D6EFF3|nr:S24 family peptidase [Spartinivicinus ruber]